jgi:phosphoribosylformylglycinamidine synthase
MDSPRALVLTGFGVNCDMEMAKAFELVGARADRVHLNDLLSARARLEDYQILALPGGFSYGDDIASGKVFANKLRFGLMDGLERFIGEGKLVLGVCNGFQMLAKMGLVPALDGKYGEQQSTLTFNDSGRFEARWVRVKADPESPCVFTRGISTMALPVRHGEGKFVAISGEARGRILQGKLAALAYCDAQGDATMEYPLNPNGSPDSVAGVCDATGRVFGLMPHPEANLFAHNDPQWAREGRSEGGGAGLKLFRNAVEYLQSRF